MKGFDAAKASHVEEIAVFGAASESFSQKNINCSIDESLDRFAPVCEAAKDAGIRVRGYVSCVLGCPYEGEIAPEKVAHVSQRLAALGCYEISLGDTIGIGTPAKAERMIEAVAAVVPARTGWRCISTTPTARHWPIFSRPWRPVLPRWIHPWPVSVAVPMPPGASGNVASEDVLYMLNGLGIEFGRRSAGAGRCRSLYLQGARPRARFEGGAGAGREEKTSLRRRRLP